MNQNSMYRRISGAALVLALVLLVSPQLSAEYRPATGGEDRDQFISPLLLGRGFSVTGTESPTASIMNPAAGARTQRTTLDLAYVGLNDFGGQGLDGHVVSAGAAFPNRYGVFSGSAQFLRSELDDMRLGTGGAAHFSAAKEVFDDLLVGAGVNIYAGTADRNRVAGGLDLGFIQYGGPFAPLPNFRFGAALKNLGNFYDPVSGRTGFPSSFTPAFGIGFTPLRTDRLEIDLSGDLSFPFFQNARLNLGSTVSFGEVVDIFAGWQIDLRQTVDFPDAERRSFLPSFGVGINLGLPAAENDAAQQGLSRDADQRGELRTRTSAAPLYQDVWAFSAGVNVPLGVIDRNPPVIRTDYRDQVYFSPNNNGVNDYFDLGISITDERYVMGYVLRVEDVDGNVVREIKHRDPRPAERNFRTFTEQLLAARAGVEIPETLRWDGTTNAGARAPDGDYLLYLSAWDDNDNRDEQGPKLVTVDTTPPQLELEYPGSEDRRFVLSDDGLSYEFTIQQSGSVEDRWTAEFVDDSDTVVRRFVFENEAPANITWDALDEDGVLVPDGIYRYRIQSTDRAGNATAEGFSNILLNTTPTPISASINTGYFSPNNNGRNDVVRISLSVPIRASLQSWELLIRDTQGRTVRSWNGRTEVPDLIVFDGRNESGNVLPEAAYHAQFRAFYQNGHRPESTTPDFVLDLTPPSASVQVETPVFSPDGDGVLDTALFFQESSVEPQWTGVFLNEAGERVREFRWRDRAAFRFEWDGRAEDGTPAPDGLYRYFIEATDRAGNYGRSNEVVVRLDTAETEVYISAEFSAFGPNANGIRDTIRFFPRLERNEDIVWYRLEVLDEDGEIVRSFSGQDRMRDSYVWDGSDTDGLPVGDGLYRTRLDMLYANGNRETAHTSRFELDTVYPRVTVEPEYSLFSPDGDGNRDTVQIRQSGSVEEVWEGEIRTAGGELVKSLFWEGTPESFVWDATDEAGNRVPDGDYRYSVSSTDRAGNTTRVETQALRVDTRPTPLFLTAEYGAFAPNGDGFRDALTITSYVGLPEGIASWEMELVHESGQTVLRRGGDSLGPINEWKWDGRGADGEIVEGRYTARVSVNYEKGNRPRAVSESFLLDISPPRVRVELDPVPFSPDDDGVDDELRISIDIQNRSDIAFWSFEILDRNDRFFREFSGRGRPSDTLIWDGRSESGQLVISAEDYPYVLTVTDVLGKTSIVEGVIPIDILVIRDGDRLRVQIANITFAPNSPELIIEPIDERGARNLAIMNRLAEIFTRYSMYSIQIEGHAVNLSGTEREEREELQPLSLARAESVKEAMVERGIASRRITAVGRGGTEPIVPHTDLDERWKNRRVEFILIR